MVIDRKKQTIEHKTFKDVIDYFDDGDVLILNNTKVFPARLYGNKEKTGARLKFSYLGKTLNNAFGMY
jgi:S-adenosylmethionine:tRNA ribosyltransferase-isomerase